jgi:hypothetical protein
MHPQGWGKLNVHIAQLWARVRPGTIVRFGVILVDFGISRSMSG